MSFTETLFGGLLIVVVLYFLARRSGLSNYWSVLLSGAIPVLAYLGYSLSHGFEGDILAIHMAVFIATAGILGVFANTQKSGQKMYWAPKLLITFFVMLVFLMALFLSISMHGLPSWVSELIMPGTKHQGMHTEFSGVTKNSHSAE